MLSRMSEFYWRGRMEVKLADLLGKSFCAYIYGTITVTCNGVETVLFDAPNNSPVQLWVGQCIPLRTSIVKILVNTTFTVSLDLYNANWAGERSDQLLENVTTDLPPPLSIYEISHSYDFPGQRGDLLVNIYWSRV